MRYMTGAEVEGMSNRYIIENRDGGFMDVTNATLAEAMAEAMAEASRIADTVMVRVHCEHPWRHTVVVAYVEPVEPEEVTSER